MKHFTKLFRISLLTFMLAAFSLTPLQAQDEIVIDLWTWTANKLEVYEGWIEEFTSNYDQDVTININLIPRANYDQTLSAALISGEIPDIWEALPLGEPLEFYENGLILDLTSFVDEEWAASLYPSTLDYLTIDGQFLSISQATNNAQALYNKDRFEELGIEAPQTMDELQAAIATLEEAGYGGAAYWASSNDHPPTLFFNWAQQMYPEEFEAASMGEGDWEIPEFVEIMEQFASYNDIWIDGVTALSLDEINSLFANGDVSVWIIGNWAVNAILAFEPEFEIGVFPVPAINEDTRPAAMGSMAGTWVLSATSEHQDVILDFVRFTTMEGQDEAVSVVGLCPAGPAGEEALADANYVTQLLCEGQEDSVPRDIFNPASRDAMASGIQGIITGRASAEDALRAADRAR
ncbi:MAG: extracellular solute-binding protein [Aggregatilineales bacterium]